MLKIVLVYFQGNIFSLCMFTCCVLRIGIENQFLQLCTARTSWSESDQAVRPCIAAIAGD